MKKILKFNLLPVLALLGLLTSTQVFAYDAPWNGGREDITGPGPGPDDDCETGNCDCPGGNNTSSPVYTARGYLVWKDVDIEFPTSTQISLQRTYNSFDFRAGLFGRGWVTAQESNIARTYKAITEGNADGSPSTATDFESLPIWLASYGRRYKLVETATTCETPDVLYFTFEKTPDGGFKQVYEDNQSYNIYSDTGVILESYSDQEGVTVYYEYDDQGRMYRQSDGYGFVLNFIYNDQGFVSQVMDQANRVWNYTYDEYGNLVQVLDPDGNTKDYAYQLVDRTGYKQHQLTAVNDNGNDPVLDVTWTQVTLYNKKGMRVSSYTEIDGHRHDYSYAPTTYNGVQAVRVTKNTKQVASGATLESETLIADAKTYSILNRVNTTKNTNEKSVFDARGNLIEETDERGNITRYEYNPAGRITKTTELAGTPDERYITTTYYNNTDRVAVLNEYGIRETRYTYDNDLRVVTRTLVDLLTNAERVWTYTYHSNSLDGQGNKLLGKVATLDGPQPGPQDMTSYSYNAQGLEARIDLPLGQSMTYSYNSAGQRISETDVNGVLTELILDSKNRVIESKTNGRITQYSYNPQNLLTSITDELGLVQTYIYNEQNQPIKITNPSGDYVTLSYAYLPGYTEITRRSFNAGGTLVSTEISRVDSLTNLPIADYLASTSQQVLQAQYDSFDDLKVETLYGQFGNVTGTTTSIYNYNYDQEGNLVSMQDGENGITNLSYDDFNQLVSVTDPNSANTTYSYLASGELSQLISPDTGVSVFEYDEAGNLVRSLNANSIDVNYTYDALNRITGIDYPGNALDVALTYDEGIFGKGNLTSVTDGSGSSQFEYDDRGLLTNINAIVDAVNFTAGYSYDDSGKLTGVQYPSGMSVIYGYGQYGHLDNIQSFENGLSTNLVSNILWNGINLHSYQYGNGLTTTYGYDNHGRLNEVSIDNSYGVKNLLDNQGQVTSQQWKLAGVVKNSDIKYDRLGQITNDGRENIEFNYDPVGNRISRVETSSGQTTTYGYENNSNRLNLVGSANILRDAAGNTLVDGSRLYVYNEMNRLSQLTNLQSNIQADYTYNYQGHRVRKQLTGSVVEDIRYLYGQYDELLGEYDSNGSRIREYVYHIVDDLPRLVAQIEADGSILYIHTDHLDTPRFASDQTQAIVWSWLGDVHGMSAADEDPDQDGVNVTVLHRFPGQQFDTESGLLYNYHRFYDPETGRYVTSDPIGLEGGINTYIYVDNNPLSKIDYLGLNPAAGAAAAAAAFCARFPKVCKNAAKCLKNPKKCKKKVCNKVNAAMHGVCDSARSCSGNDSCFKMRLKKAHLYSCIGMRKAVKACHGKKNDPNPGGHQRAIQQVKNRINRCNRLMNKNCC